MVRIVFMGTPEFAVPTLKALADAHQVVGTDKLKLVGVVTQPDRKAGRGRELRPSPVKEVALERGLPLFQPQTLRLPAAVKQLKDWKPDVIVVAAFGQILRQDVLDLPSYGCLNVHASLLPRWRGAAPVVAAILAGDEVTGVTIMKMDAGLDTGPTLKQSKPQKIETEYTRAELEKRLAQAGADLLIETLPAYLAGDLVPQPQPEEGVTYAPQLRKEDGQIDWRKSAVELDRQVRAVTPWPGASTTLQGRRFKILQAIPLPDWRGDAPPGTIVALAGGCAVATGRGALRLEVVQLAGKRPMNIEAFLCGQHECVGTCLGVIEE
ncbi:MAG: methionyl-tRNA formyltransferase [Anaerolineae bacterium]|nr:methionyl-tRNA formyltransferase [Anaerolineae bacterium]